MKIKDIINEQGFWSSFGKALLPGALRQVADANKPTAAPTDLELAQSAQKKFGNNPESELPGVLGWLTPEQQKAIVAAKEKELRKKERADQAQRKKPTSAQKSQGLKKLAKDIFNTPAASAPITTSTQPAPPQVRMRSGEYITKYGDYWFDEQGQRITIPGDVERLERMSRGPAGQAQMASTKNVPVQTTMQKGKR